MRFSIFHIVLTFDWNNRMDPDTFREPCPDRILDDIGGAFAMGAVGGSAYHFFMGLRNSPSGERLAGGYQAVRMNAHLTAGAVAAWGGIFSVVDCTMVYARQKEDPWNSIIAGAATNGILNMRRGFASASRSALFGGVLLAFIEGVVIMLDKGLTDSHNLPMTIEDSNSPAGQFPGMDPPTPEPSSSSGGSSWFAELFGGGKKQETKTEILESFDTPSPTPMPTFPYK